MGTKTRTSAVFIAEVRCLTIQKDYREAYVQGPNSTESLRSGPIESEVPTHARRCSNRSDDGRQDGDDNLQHPFPRDFSLHRSMNYSCFRFHKCLILPQISRISQIMAARCNGITQINWDFSDYGCAANSCNPLNSLLEKILVIREICGHRLRVRRCRRPLRRRRR